MAVTVETFKENTVSGDSQFMVSEYDLLSSTNTFDMDALDKTLDFIGTRNFWALYRNQRSRIGMERFDIPIKEFQLEYRTNNEMQIRMYSRRYVHYVNRKFVYYTKSNAFRQSEFYKKALNQETIGKHPDLFAWNFLLFVNGELVTTCEILPMESNTGIIIDIASKADEHGVSHTQFQRWIELDATVSVVFVPNFRFTDSMQFTRATLINKYKQELPFSHVNDITNNDLDTNQLNWDTLIFHNTPKDLHVKWLCMDADIYVREQLIRFKNVNSFRETATVDLAFINFDPDTTNRYTVKGNEPYFRMRCKMPCPKEHLLVFVTKPTGYTRMGYDIKINQYYHNIYELEGLEENETATVFVFYTENGVNRSETYFRQIEVYEMYFDLILQYKNKTIPQILKEYSPLDYKYNEMDYLKYHSDVTPSVYSYKIDKLRNAIEKDPWSLWAYLIFLKLSYGKHFVYMEELDDLDDRLRKDTSQEPIDHSYDATFGDMRYVFAIHRSYISGYHWGFRIFIDGLFIDERYFMVRESMDFYFLYVSEHLITPTSVLEIERYKRMDFATEKTFTSTMDSYELVLEADVGNTIYVNDIYLVNLDTGKYLKKDEYSISIEVTYANSKKEIVTGFREVDTKSYMRVKNKAYIRVKTLSHIGNPIQIGIHKQLDMVLSETYLKDPTTESCYAIMYMKNEGNYTVSSYRCFRNGRYALPAQMEVIDRGDGQFGGIHEVRSIVATKHGDQLALDHVPANFRLVYYQAEIEESGYVDVDGAINLPISLRWYDIYVNGVRLSPKNLWIISPTRFYIKGVKSRKNLAIVDRDRNDDVFFLQPHYFYIDGEDDRNDTLIDKLLDIIKATIDDSLPKIPDEEPDNSGEVISPDVIDAIIFFEEFMKYTFIDCNLRQLDDETIKERFHMLFDSDGRIPINANIHPEGTYLKVINPNERLGERDGN